MELRDNIARFRARSGYKSQTSLANALGIAPVVVSYWESGAREPTFQQAKKLLELGMPVDELFGYDCTQSCQKSVQYKQVDQRPGLAAESSKNYSASELNDPLADSPTMQAVLKRLADLEQRNEGNAKKSQAG